MTEADKIKGLLEQKNQETRESNPLWREIKVAELVAQIKEVVKCDCDLATLKEPLMVSVRCKCCGRAFYDEAWGKHEEQLLAEMEDHE